MHCPMHTQPQPPAAPAHKDMRKRPVTPKVSTLNDAPSPRQARQIAWSSAWWARAAAARLLPGPSACANEASEAAGAASGAARAAAPTRARLPPREGRPRRGRP